MKTEPIVDKRIETIVDEELKNFGVPQGDPTKIIEEMNLAFIKKFSNSLAHRAEGKIK